MGSISKILLVLGPHRSGSSLTSHMLETMDIFHGPKELLMGSSKENEKGYWEYLPLVKLHEEMLSSLGRSWHNPPRNLSEEDVENLQSLFGIRAKQLVLEMDIMSEGKTWCFKDPRLGSFLPFWKKNLANRACYALVTNRHPFAVAASLYKREQFPAVFSYTLQKRILASINDHLDFFHSTHQINYEDFFTRPEKVFDNVVSFLQKNELSTHFSRDVFLQEVLDPSLMHHGSFQEEELASFEAEEGILELASKWINEKKENKLLKANLRKSNRELRLSLIARYSENKIESKKELLHEKNCHPSV